MTRTGTAPARPAPPAAPLGTPLRRAARALAAAALALWAALAAPARAEDLSAPSGAILLTVTGEIAVRNAGDAAAFDLALLERLPPARIVTTTIWTEGPQVFEGVRLADLLARLGVQGGALRATALNDDGVDLPVSDATPDGPIVAFRRNGAPMSARDKGPLWVVHPCDADPAFRTETVYARSIWQLDRIEVRR